MSLLTVETQPTFPATDLSDINREMIPALLAHESGLSGHASHLEGYHRSLHHMAHRAIHDILDIKLHYSAEEYRAFTEGYTDFEAMSMIVRNDGTTNTSLALGRVGMYHIAPGAFVDYEFSERFVRWPDERPNTFDAIISIGHARGDSDMQRAQLRRAGAQIAFELQRPPLDLA